MENDEVNRHKLEEWINKLDNVNSQEELIDVCKDIYTNFNSQLYHAAEHNALNHALLQHFTRALDLTSLKILSKAQARISIPDIETLISIQPKLDSYEKVIMLYGFFNSCKMLDKNCAKLEMFNLCLGLLNESAKKSREEENDYLLLLSVENMTSYFKFYGTEGEKISNLDLVFRMIDLHLETSLQGVRDRLLGLFAKIVKHEPYTTQVLLPLLLKRPWTDRNKYYLLAELIDEQKFCNLKGSNEPNLKDDLFFKGICLSLKYRHLFSPGQAVMKVLLKQEVPQAREVVAEVFVHGTFIEKKHLIENWACLWSARDKDAIFERICTIIELESIFQMAKLEHESFVMLVLLRSTFSGQFVVKSLHEVVDGMIKDKWANLSGSRFVEGHVYEIFVENITTNVGNRSSALEFLKNFLRTRYEVQDAAFRQNLINKLPQLLLHLSKQGISNDDVFNFMQFLHDELFVQGIKSEIYQAQIFAVKLLQTMLLLFFTPIKDHIGHGKRIHDTHFGETLIKEGIWNMNEETYQKNLIHLACNSDFDDVRLLTFELISKYLLNFTSHERMYDLNYPQFQTKLLIESKDDNKSPDLLIKHFKAALDITEESLQQMKKDPLNAVKNEINLYKPLDCLNEFLIASEKVKLENLENDGELIELVKCVSDVIIDLINSKEQGLDFSKLDENLELLVEQSHAKSDSIEKDKKLLLQSFWHTLRACAELASNYGIYIIKNRAYYSKPLKRLLFCSDIIINILVFCCHKGAIESAAIAIGRLFNYFTKHWIKTLQSYSEEEIESISNAFMNKVLRPLDKIQTLDIRCNRGLILLHMQVLKNDMTIGRTMRQQCLKIFIERLTNLTESDEPKPMVPFLISLFLHDLSKYFNDTELTDDVIPFLEQIILISFSYIRSSYWNIKNAALTLFGSLIPKIMKQKSKSDNLDDEWQSVCIHIDELIFNLPKVSCHMLSELQAANKLPASTIVLYLELLSSIEVKEPEMQQHADAINLYRAKFWQLLGHKSDKIRRLAALCFAQFHHYHEEIPRVVLTIIPFIFRTSCGENFKHGLVLAVNCLIQKLKSHYQFIHWPDRDAFFNEMRITFNKYYRQDRSPISYYTRCYLLNLLLYLGFNLNDLIVRWILYERSARNYFGYAEWNNLVGELLECAKSRDDIEKDVSMDEMSVSFSEA